MMDDQSERIRKRAHEIWQEEGSPEGREYSHWLRARAEIQAEEIERPRKADPSPLEMLGLNFGSIQPA